MLTLIFEAHSTSLDNENHLSSGWNDVALSSTGSRQARDLGSRRASEKFDAIFCSDLQRSYKTAEIAFNDNFPIIKDPRLRECDYGDLTQHPSSEVDNEKPKRINVPFTGGESYEQTAARMKNFLEDLIQKYPDGKVLVIGHRATQYGIERWVNGTPLLDSIKGPWKWQPGWTYKITKLHKT